MRDISGDINTLGTAVHGSDMRTSLVNIATELNDRTAGGGAYTLPVATSTTLGGVKVGSGLQVTGAGVLGTSKDLNVMSDTLDGIADDYVALRDDALARRSQINAAIGSISLSAGATRTQNFSITQPGVYWVCIQRYINNNLTSGRLTLTLDSAISVTQNYTTFVGGGCITLTGLVYLAAGSHTISYASTLNAACTLTTDTKFNYIKGVCLIPDVVIPGA